MTAVGAVLLCAALAADPLGPGDHARGLSVDGLDRTYLVHVPLNHDATRPAPVVLVLHGAATTARMNVGFTGMSEKSDQAGFIAVYPNGTGPGSLLTWNSGLRRGKQADDVKFISRLLDDLGTVVRIDPKRVYATGMSNGGMMCYRLAAELSDRIAAIAPVAGTMAIPEARPGRPVPVLHFHGTADRIVPFGGFGAGGPKAMTLKSVRETIRTWCKVNQCDDTPKISTYPDRVEDGTTVSREDYAPGRDGVPVSLVIIQGGGHTWPGRKPPVGFLGRHTQDISANDLIWEFFQKHPMK